MANIVYNDLKKSPFNLHIDGYTLYFSSVFHRNKFKKEYKEYIKENSLKFKNRYKIDINLDEVFLLSFYKRVENRGFLVYYQNIPLDGNGKIKNIIL